MYYNTIFNYDQYDITYFLVKCIYNWMSPDVNYALIGINIHSILVRTGLRDWLTLI